MALASAATSDAVVVNIIRYASGLLFETRPLRKIFILDDFVCGFFFLLSAFLSFRHIPPIADVFRFPIYFPHFSCTVDVLYALML